MPQEKKKRKPKSPKGSKSANSSTVGEAKDALIAAQDAPPTGADEAV